MIGESALRLLPWVNPPIIGEIDLAFETNEGAPQPRASDGASPKVIDARYGSVRRVKGKHASDVSFILCGEFDIYNGRYLVAALEKATTCRTITIDLAQTTYIDATILGIFARAASRRRRFNASRLQITHRDEQRLSATSIPSTAQPRYSEATPT